MKTTEIKAGYKQTEVGVIPEDWVVKKLGDFSNVSSGGTPNRKVASYWAGDIPWITTSQIDFNFINCANEFITEEGLNNSAAKMYKADTLLMAMYGQGKTRGKVAILGIDAATNQACAAISLNNEVLKEFVFYNLSGRYDEIRSLSNNGNQENLNGDIIKKILIPVPSTIKEQTAIATALSDTDSLIGSLEKLIAKKRNIKQGAMQKLLSESGFAGLKDKQNFEMDNNSANPINSDSDIWEVKKLGDYLDYIQPTEFLVSDTEYNDNNQIPVLTAGKTFILGYTNEEHGIFTRLPVIIFDDFTTAIKFVDFPFKAKSSAMKMLVPKNDKVNLRFIYEIMLQINYPLGDHKRHWIGEYQYLEIIVPQSIKIQSQIATTLSDMDAEIAALEGKLAKFRNIKLGMMQVLLTGKIRLVNNCVNRNNCF